jgi:hypothetical protein
MSLTAVGGSSNLLAPPVLVERYLPYSVREDAAVLHTGPGSYRSIKKAFAAYSIVP